MTESYFTVVQDKGDTCGHRHKSYATAGNCRTTRQWDHNKCKVVKVPMDQHFAFVRTCAVAKGEYQTKCKHTSWKITKASASYRVYTCQECGNIRYSDESEGT